MSSVIAETPFHNDPLEYQLTELEDGVKTAANPSLSVSILNDGDTKLFKRRAIKGIGGGTPTYHTMIVAELDGVRVYIKGNDIVISKQDLRL